MNRYVCSIFPNSPDCFIWWCKVKFLQWLQEGEGMKLRTMLIIKPPKMWEPNVNSQGTVTKGWNLVVPPGINYLQVFKWTVTIMNKQLLSRYYKQMLFHFFKSFKQTVIPTFQRSPFILTSNCLLFKRTGTFTTII